MKLPSIACIACSLVAAPVIAQDDADALAQQLANPVASLISAPIQFNYDAGYAGGGWRSVTNVQPVIPISISEDWNLISRTILPLIIQEDVTGPGSRQTGSGDILATAFFSPKEPTESGLIWGVGPVLSIPVGGSDLSADELLLGPSAVFLRQQGVWTYGALINQVWDASSSSGGDVSAAFLQPFVTWGGLGQGRTIAVNLESTYDWNSSQWNAPINIMFNQVSKIGDQLVSYQLGGRVYLDRPTGGPDWGIRLAITFLFPTG